VKSTNKKYSKIPNCKTLLHWNSNCIVPVVFSQEMKVIILMTTTVFLWAVGINCMARRPQQDAQCLLTCQQQWKSCTNHCQQYSVRQVQNKDICLQSCMQHYTECQKRCPFDSPPDFLERFQDHVLDGVVDIF
jgi:hypothetical protein